MGEIVDGLAGVIVTKLKRIETPGGDVFHAMKASEAGYDGFGEAYFSTIIPESIKAWKRHTAMTLNLVVIAGSVRFVLYDDRGDSPTKGKYQSVKIGPMVNYSRLTVPPKLWMAFQCIGSETGVLLNIANIEHDPDEVTRKTIGDINFDWSIE
jgi:dTDP-4-dehydrorhamnose 3,5-epimerase